MPLPQDSSSSRWPTGALFAAGVLGVALLGRAIANVATPAGPDLIARRFVRAGWRRASACDRVIIMADPHAVMVEAGLAALLLPRLRPRDRVELTLAPLLAIVVGNALKSRITRKRPRRSRLRRHGAESFPSTHTASAGALLLAAADVARRHGSSRAAALTPALALMSAVGIQRIRSGAHWPTDVLAGACLALAASISGRTLLGIS